MANDTPDHVASSAVRGEVAAALGPHRSSGQWWENAGWSREEWDVELKNGTLLRLACLATGWVVEGLYEMPAPPSGPGFQPRVVS